MKAVCWYGKKDVRVEQVPDPKILNQTDVIVKVSLTAICGSDLHLYNSFIPSLEKGDILGHEFMGEVVETGKKVERIKVGDKVVIPFNIACGSCHFCSRDLTSLCDNSNPNGLALEKLTEYSTSALFGYSHLFGGYAGGQAQYVRVPYADVGCFVVDKDIPDERLLFMTDILPTGYMAAENADIRPGSVVAVWGAGPVGLMAMKSARILGAERVIAIDNIPERLELARTFADAECVNESEVENLTVALREMTAGRGPDACIDAVGLEAHGNPLEYAYDRIKQAAMLETDRPIALRHLIHACAKGGTVSIPGVYGGLVDKFPLGAAFGKGLSFKMGQTHVHKYLPTLYNMILNDGLDPSAIISHMIPLERAAHGYDIFCNKQDQCVKVVLKP